MQNTRRNLNQLRRSLKHQIKAYYSELVTDIEATLSHATNVASQIECQDDKRDANELCGDLLLLLDTVTSLRDVYLDRTVTCVSTFDYTCKHLKELSNIKHKIKTIEGINV